jgi:hypothetical protein
MPVDLAAPYFWGAFSLWTFVMWYVAPAAGGLLLFAALVAWGFHWNP